MANNNKASCVCPWGYRNAADGTCEGPGCFDHDDAVVPTIGGTCEFINDFNICRGVPDFFRESCAESCGYTCTTVPCADAESASLLWFGVGCSEVVQLCGTDAVMDALCPATCGLCNPYVPRTNKTTVL